MWRFIFISKQSWLLWAKVGTDKEEAYKTMINQLLDDMRKKNAERADEEEE